ncbi:MAG: histone H4-K20 monomethylation [Paramarteilia canceri]
MLSRSATSSAAHSRRRDVGSRSKKVVKSSNSPITDYVSVAKEREKFFSPSFKPLDNSKNPTVPQISRCRKKLLLDNLKITEYSKVVLPKLSGRVPRQLQNTVKQKQWFECLKLQLVEGIEYCLIEGKGRAVRSTRDFDPDEFVIEYQGELLTGSQAKMKEKEYEASSETMSKDCYMFYFEHNLKNYCIDATKETDDLGRLINHSRTSSNLRVQLLEVNDKPKLFFVTSRPVKQGEELLFDYNERNPQVLTANPWLRE